MSHPLKRRQLLDKLTKEAEEVSELCQEFRVAVARVMGVYEGIIHRYIIQWQKTCTAQPVVCLMVSNLRVVTDLFWGVVSDIKWSACPFAVCIPGFLLQDTMCGCVVLFDAATLLELVWHFGFHLDWVVNGYHWSCSFQLRAAIQLTKVNLGLLMFVWFSKRDLNWFMWLPRLFHTVI